MRSNQINNFNNFILNKSIINDINESFNNSNIFYNKEIEFTNNNVIKPFELIINNEINNVNIIKSKCDNLKQQLIECQKQYLVKFCTLYNILYILYIYNISINIFITGFCRNI